MIKKILLAIMAVIFIVSLAPYAAAQSTQEKRRVEEGKREDLKTTEEQILEGEKRLILDYGGWLNYRFDDYDDDDNDSSAKDTLNYTNSVDARFWLKATLRPPANASYKNEHSIYLRLKNIYTITRPQDINEEYDNDGPHVDYAYAVADLRPYWIEFGRRYFNVGQGIAYSNVNDGVELSASFTDWNLSALVSHTLPHEDNIDLSVPGGDKESDRAYYGVEARYIGIVGHAVYAYSLIQRDDSNESPESSADFTYDSEYLGFGLQGKLTARTHYWSEIIRETGESRIYTTGEKKDVDASGGDFGISYDLDVYSHPNFTVEYAFGSGDSDRSSVTDTLGGNTSGDDKNFLYFGYLPTGYALSPRLSNLKFYKAGLQLKPLENIGRFKNLTFGVDYYRYFKDKKDGGIYDLNATVSDDDVGSEIDLNINWQILSDLTWTMQYGHFMPGDAYSASANDSEDYFATDLTLTF